MGNWVNKVNCANKVNWVNNINWVDGVKWVNQVIVIVNSFPLYLLAQAISKVQNTEPRSSYLKFVMGHLKGGYRTGAAEWSCLGRHKRAPVYSNVAQSVCSS